MTIRTVLAAALLVAVTACGPAAQKAAPPETPAAATQDGPPTVNGVYIAKDKCPGEGCAFGKWRATKPVQVLDAIGPSPRVVATIAVGEKVEAVTGEVHLKPLRGVVRRDSDPLKQGDVVWLLDYVGEGESNVWRRGEIVPWMDDGDQANPAIAWDAHGENANEAVWWVRIRRPDGSTAWLRDPESFECMDLLSGDQGCER